MSKFKKVLKNVRFIILVIALVLAIASINPSFSQQGAAIRNVAKNSSASDAGIVSPAANVPPRSREVVMAINNIPVDSEVTYHEVLAQMPVNQSITVKTNVDTYILQTKEVYNITFTGKNITRNVTREYLNETTNETITYEDTITESEVLKIPTGEVDIGLTVYDAPTNNIRKGLDLTGGTRVILKPEKKVTPEDMEILLENIKQRLNVFGLSDIIVRDASDLTGNQFIIVEIAGATREEVSELLAKQGKFEANVGNETVFRGGNDITYVCRSADCSGLDPRRGCGQDSNGNWFCQFYFVITLSPEAAQRQADATKELSLVTQNGEPFLSEPLFLFLDDQEVDRLNIAASLQGRAVTDIQISGSGNGITREEAQSDSLIQMRRLQTILITGSLPVKLGIEKIDNISPALGEEFLSNAIMIGLLAIAAVIIVVFLRYRRPIIAAPMVITMLSEAIIILGIASIIGWNLDLAAIAGIIIAIGTGVDDQIVIADETLTQRGRATGKSWKDRLKNAFFIIFAAYFTLVVAMIPLWFAGAGMLRGFAITTILGVSVGVFITRPAYAVFLEVFSEE
ncbi:hypothetical protein ACFL1B_05920 [Nanoarchaeota archaeon]